MNLLGKVSGKLKTKLKNCCCILLVIIISVILVSCGESHEGQAKTPSGSSIQKGRDYNDVIQTFKNHGFTNIKTNTIDDLVFGWLTKDGEVESVSVDGDVNYSPDTWYPKDVEVIITYHTFPDDGSVTEITETETYSIEKPTETPTSPPTNIPTEIPTQKPTEENKIPFNVPDGFTVLQAFFCSRTLDDKLEDIEELAQQCGFDTYKESSRDDFIDMDISVEPNSEKTDYIHIAFDTYTGSVRLHRINYYFNTEKTNTLHVEYYPIRWEDGSEVLSYRSYDVKDDNEKIDSFREAEPAMRRAKYIAE